MREKLGVRILDIDRVREKLGVRILDTDRVREKLGVRILDICETERKRMVDKEKEFVESQRGRKEETREKSIYESIINLM